MKALKAGEKEYQARLQRHEDPYLPVLDELVPDVSALPAVSLGLVQIPVKQIVGTSTKGRTSAFAANFMPLLGWKSEFANKWARLYSHVVEEGVRDAIVVQEYMNKFYVVEGNKRVSVMKMLDAVSVEAIVTRIIPKRTDEKENKIYFEFLPFYEATGQNNIWFSEEGGFEKLASYVGRKHGEKWTQEEIYDFRSLYSRFSTEFEEQGGDKLGITAGDALLVYLEIYGYKDAMKKLASEMREDIRRIWVEFQVKSNDEQVTLLMQPTEEAPRGVLASMLRPAPQNIRAAFIYQRTPMESGWTYMHEMGRKHIEMVFGSRVETTCRENVSIEDAEQVIEELIAEGYQVIFTTSPVFLNATLRPSVEHPEVKILNCSLLASYHHVRSYYLRIYEAKFVIGAIAGALAENDRIGYIADYPIYGVPASINAFALGARLTNPRAKVYLEWSMVKDRDMYQTFRDNDVNIISNKDISAPHQGAREFGLYRVDGETSTNLAMPAWHWGRLYEALIRSILSGSWKGEATIGSGRQALNYWLGMSAEAIEVFCSRKLPADTQKLVKLLIRNIQSGAYNPFSGLMVDQSGVTQCKDNEELSPADIIAMDWLLDNVVGDMPDLSMLKEEAQALVSLQGIKNTAGPDTSAFSWTGLPGKEDDE
ncbi:MAG: BMP family ABC transporter substrate-binding protein [Clostridia bacterium]|nr:BMP family ABC transporter substrate-binding protein [Clostridia bacterium]